MSTGNFENWAGEIAEIGAVYPFVGAETIMVIAGVVFWLWWHIKQTRMENSDTEEAIKNFGDKASLSSIVEREDPEFP